MKAYVRSVRIAPKKANIIAKMVRGMPVPDAVEALRHTHKKAARIVETLLRSAIANASHNDRQDPQTMIVKTIVVNQAQAYHRGVPMARGRMRPMRKYLSHIELALGYADEGEMSQTPRRPSGSAGQESETTVKKAAKKPSQSAANAVKTSRTSAKKQQDASSKKSADSASSAEAPAGAKADESSVSTDSSES